MRIMSRCVEFSNAVVDSTVRDLIEDLHQDMVHSVEDQQEERDGDEQHVNHQPGGPLFAAGFDPIEASLYKKFKL